MPRDSMPLRLGWSTRRELISSFAPNQWRIGRFKRAALAWDGAWFSVNDWLQQKAYADQLASVVAAPDPIFVLGFWRSGTTLLHELLCCDDRFGFPTTAQCMNPSTMLLGKRAARGQPLTIARPMDAMPVSADGPQEDEFALLALGLPSAYRFLLVPADVSRALYALSPESWNEQERHDWMARFAGFVRRVQFREPRPLIFKSPTHTFRTQLLGNIWPQARFVLIRRDPVHVWLSNMRLWETLLARYALARWERTNIEEFVSRAYRMYLARHAELRRDLRPGRLVELEYEAMASNPPAQLERIYQSFGFPVSDRVRRGWKGLLAERAGHRVQQYDVSERERHAILAQLGLE